jgi:hypothetical protein
MWDEADLNDDDLRAIYGDEALRVRITATIVASERAYAATRDRLARLYASFDQERTEPPAPAP